MLPNAFLTRPIAHRGLHDVSSGVPENSRAAVLAAVEHGYGIEIDLQLTADDSAVVFHDYSLERLTEGVGPVRQRTQADMATLRLAGGHESVPSFPEVLELVAGRVPLLVELKDQDGALGPEVGPLEAAVADALTSYDGPVAVMSFNPHAMSALQALVPDVPRGLVTDAFLSGVWDLPDARRADLAGIVDFERVGASFISHNHSFLDAAPVSALKARNVPILCWTIRSEHEERVAREIADNITFEGYFAAIEA
ncbi:MAG: glycerophosphodiester phosphodiesterase family protein [Paracoccaceae bacterium]